VTTQSFSNATLVPSVAIIQVGSQSVVYTVTNNVAHQTPVTTGISDDTNTQILSGVKPGDLVATINQTNLSEGTRVRIAGGASGQTGGSGGANGTQQRSGTAGANGQPGSGRSSAGSRTAATATPANGG
jgi:multidrug efflux system membrane fusion protein